MESWHDPAAGPRRIACTRVRNRRTGLGKIMRNKCEVIGSRDGVEALGKFFIVVASLQKYFIH